MSALPSVFVVDESSRENGLTAFSEWWPVNARWRRQRVGRAPTAVSCRGGFVQKRGTASDRLKWLDPKSLARFLGFSRPVVES
jgi:hypothetical protein